MTQTLTRTNGHAVDVDLETGLITAPAAGLNPLYDVTAARQQMAALQALVNTYLRPSSPGKTDGDYGIIPGTGDKPVLLKSGADKLCDVYGLLPLYEELGVVEDWEKGLLVYRLRCRIVLKASGQQVGEGVGACNSRETKYQTTEWWNDRNAAPPADQGWQEIQTKKGKAWKRKVTNDNPADLQNTILKMAKKRALVDAVLSVTRSSGLFTQDLEDYAVDDPAITEAQVAKLTTAFSKLDWSADRALTWVRDQLTTTQAEALLQNLRVLFRAAQEAIPATDSTPAAAPSGDIDL